MEALRVATAREECIILLNVLASPLGLLGSGLLIHWPGLFFLSGVLGAERAGLAGEVPRPLLHVYRLRGNPAAFPGTQPHQTLHPRGEEDKLQLHNEFDFFLEI
jgi:hypothetical protein